MYAMTTPRNRAIYNERRRSLARRGISIPDAFGTDAEGQRDLQEWLADQDSGSARMERDDVFDAESSQSRASR
jgi:hypothetical protein